MTYRLAFIRQPGFIRSDFTGLSFLSHNILFIFGLEFFWSIDFLEIFPIFDLSLKIFCLITIFDSVYRRIFIWLWWLMMFIWPWWHFLRESICVGIKSALCGAGFIFQMDFRHILQFTYCRMLNWCCFSETGSHLIVLEFNRSFASGVELGSIFFRIDHVGIVFVQRAILDDLIQLILFRIISILNWFVFRLIAWFVVYFLSFGDDFLLWI